MKQNKFFTNIYYSYDEHNYLNIMLYNEVYNTAILFDGLAFFYKTGIKSIPDGFTELDYSLQSRGKILEVEAFKQSWDVTFIKFKNGDIFQLYFMSDDNMSNQKLSILTKLNHDSIMTPLGISLYDSVTNNCRNAEECEVSI
jgi:hypothetical protein